MVFANEVNILNISLGCASLRADRRLNIGKEYTVKMKVGNSFISVKGKVIWSLLSESRGGANGEFIPIYTAGIRFADGSDEKIEKIMKFIKRKADRNDDAGHHDVGLMTLHDEEMESVLTKYV